MLRGFTLTLLLILLLSKPEAAQLSQSDQEKLRFQHDWNEFAHEANNLMRSYEDSNLWDVKQAKHVENLFDHLRKEPGWKVR